MNLIIINTNKSTNKRYELEMLEEQKCSAYRATKNEITQIRKGDIVLLYSNDRGIIASGKADGNLKMKPDNGEENAEYYMGLNEFYEYISDISYGKILSIIKKADPSFARPFNQTLLKFPLPNSAEIWHEVNKYV
ncbi:hypothetical protein [Metabacillus indicus]|uniref:hypothetical protein n=1 Tax=Metabacillus indicus TaxID=246786 RepID=UPI00049322B4|nr:hypothetical protein [Metabacillus indicus]KEZ48806.1 hypothetical protein AZ46_0218165 [Metabacillus indicus LMG 22858]